MLMKRYNFYLIAIIISILAVFNCQAQTHCLPDLVIAKITEELVIKDHLERKSALQDSLIAVYADAEKTSQKIIAQHEAKDKEQDLIISNKQELLDGEIAKGKDLQATNKKLKIKNVLLAIGISAETAAIIALALIILL
jgi:hypothetical protein